MQKITQDQWTIHQDHQSDIRNSNGTEILNQTNQTGIMLKCYSHSPCCKAFSDSIKTA